MKNHGTNAEFYFYDANGSEMTLSELLNKIPVKIHVGEIKSADPKTAEKLHELLDQIADENRHEEIDFDNVKELIEENRQLKERVKHLKYDVLELEDINFDLQYDIQKLKEQIKELKKENEGDDNCQDQ